jgi:hypothetical protein
VGGVQGERGGVETVSCRGAARGAAAVGRLWKTKEPACWTHLIWGLRARAAASRGHWGSVHATHSTAQHAARVQTSEASSRPRIQ